jgi:hypothetical protein
LPCRDTPELTTTESPLTVTVVLCHHRAIVQYLLHCNDAYELTRTENYLTPK